MVEVENKVQRYDTYKDSGVGWLGEIPKHWEATRVKNIFRLVVEPAPINNDFELLSVYTDIGVRPRRELKERGNKASTTDGYWLVKKGDVIVNKLLAWMGAIGVSNYDGVTSPAYDILRAKVKIESNFYHYLFRNSACISELKKHSRGIMDMRLRLYFDKFGDVVIPYPKFEEQKIIVNFLDDKTTKIDDAIAIKEQQINLLKERKQILIHKAVTRGLDDSVTLKDSGVEWIGAIPEHWVVKRLKYLGNTFAGITGKSGEDFSKEQKEGFKPFVPFTSIFNNEIINTAKHQYVNIRENEYQNKVKKDDLLFLMSSETIDDIGKCSIYLGMENELYLNSFCKGFRFSNPIINAVFTNHLLQSYNYRHYFSLKGRGFTRINIKQEFVLEIPILIPPLSEQKEISTYIETASQKIETAIGLKQQEIAKLKEYKSSLINGVVTGKVRVC